MAGKITLSFVLISGLGVNGFGISMGHGLIKSESMINNISRRG